jgi:uncharacterized protein YodC (DUF2158 family)
MKNAKHLLIALLTLGVGTLAAAGCSAHLGRRVWSPQVFAWRNFLRQAPNIEYQPDSPLLITNPRYYSFMSIGSAIGGVLRFEIINRSDKPIHSYHCRWYSPNQMGNGAYGAWANSQEGSLLPTRSTEGAISAHEYFQLTLTIDFVQFSDGTTWFSTSPEATVKPGGVEAGARDAAEYLCRLLDREGAAAVMRELPRIRADVVGEFFTPEVDKFGTFGFYCGVTKMEVLVRHAYEEGGLERVAAAIRSFSSSAST